MEERVALCVGEGVADVRLARPNKMNALDEGMFEAIAGVIEQLGNQDEVRAVVLSGEGRCFCGGLDRQLMTDPRLATMLRSRDFGIANLAQQAAWGWHILPVPVIAAVHGVAFGGGLQIMSGADIRIAHPATRFAIRESVWGLVPDMAGIALWRRLVRDDVLRELTYTAREFGAEEALTFGFVTRISDDPLREARAMALEIASHSPSAIGGAKRLLNAAVDQDSAAILLAESQEQQQVIGRRNHLEAVTAALENRTPRFISPALDDRTL